MLKTYVILDDCLCREIGDFIRVGEKFSWAALGTKPGSLHKVHHCLFKRLEMGNEDKHRKGNQTILPARSTTASIEGSETILGGIFGGILAV